MKTEPTIVKTEPTMNTIKFNSRVTEWAWLSNMAPCRIEHEGLVYQSTEAAYQASKTLDLSRRQPFTTMTGMQSKMAGKNLPLRPQWCAYKGPLMGVLLRQKFAAGSALAERLLATGSSKLIEDAPWDAYWGNGRDGKGQNVMGRLLMKIRKELAEANA